MAISNRLVMRQGQALVMTPQLLQAIKLLQFSNIELSSFLSDELERNPLLEADGADSIPSERSVALEGETRGVGDDAPEAFDGPREGDWAGEGLSIDSASLSAELGTEISNAFEPEGPGVSPSEPVEALEGAGLSATSWNGAAGGGGADGEAPNLEAYVAAQKGLHEYLADQLALCCAGARQRFIGRAIIDAIDETGYLRESVEDIADRLGASAAETAAVLAIVQTLDPSGVGARDLAECLAIQLRERDRFDPAMEIFVANLPLVAKRDFAQLSKLCGVDEEDILDMAAVCAGSIPSPAAPSATRRRRRWWPM